MIDLRSDTLTQPTPDMRQAMAAAPVGDDVFHLNVSPGQIGEAVELMRRATRK